MTSPPVNLRCFYVRMRFAIVSTALHRNFAAGFSRTLPFEVLRNFAVFVNFCSVATTARGILVVFYDTKSIVNTLNITSVRFGPTTEVQSEKASLNFARFFVCECILKRTTRTPQTMEMWGIIVVTLVLLQPVISRKNSPCRNKPLYKCKNLFGSENFPLVLRLHITVHAFPIYATCARVRCNLGRLECK